MNDQDHGLDTRDQLGDMENTLSILPQTWLSNDAPTMVTYGDLWTR